MPGFTYVPGDDGFYHVLFMNIVDVGQVTVIRPAYDLTLKKHHTVSMCTEDKMLFPDTISYNINYINISITKICL